MANSKLDKFILRTWRPGMRIVDITVDKDYQIELDAYKKGTLRKLHPERGDINHDPHNFHLNHMLMDHQGDIKEDLVIHAVPLLNDDGSENVEGIYEIDRADEMLLIQFLNFLAGTKDKRVSLDTRFGLSMDDVSPEAKKMLKRLKEDEPSDLNNKERLNRRPNGG